MIIAGNWKMNPSRAAGTGLARAVEAFCRGQKHPPQVVIFPPAILIESVMAQFGDKKAVKIGGQDCHIEHEGAFTGDISALMFKELGCSWILAGHSERRHGHGEGNDTVIAKARSIVESGLNAMVCVGETLEQRESGETKAVLKSQIENLSVDANRLAIAYEPVWAIGTGRNADAQTIAGAHGCIKTALKDIGTAYADVPILYGGSVTPDNAASILKIDDVGGVLVGGASLDAEKFTTIIELAAKCTQA